MTNTIESEKDPIVEEKKIPLNEENNTLTNESNDLRTEEIEELPSSKESDSQKNESLNKHMPNEEIEPISPNNKQEDSPAPTQEPKKEPEMNEPTKQNEIVTIKKTGTALSIIAILLSSIAIGGSGFLLYIAQKEVAKIDRNTYSINSKTASTDLNLDEKFKNTNNEIARTDAQNKETQKALADKIAQLENDLKLADNKTNEKLTLLYQELTRTQLARTLNNTEITLNMAQTQLQLSNNIPAVVSVLEETNKQLEELNIAQLTPLQEAIKQDITALNNTPSVDTAQLSSELEMLGNEVFKLPTLAQTVANAPTDQQIKEQQQKTPALTTEANSWWARTWNSIKSGLSSLVEVKQKSPTNKPELFSPEQSYFVRENMRLQFNDARLALLQKNEKIYLADLNAIKTSALYYLDPKSTEVQKLLTRLEELKKINFPVSAQLTTSISTLNNIQKTVKATIPSFILEEPKTASGETSLFSNEPKTASEDNKAPIVASETAPSTNVTTKTGGQSL